MSALSDFVCTSAWALSQPVHQQLVALVLRHAEGHKASQEDIDAVTAARDARKERDLPASYQNRDGVGVVPISGVIARHARQVNGASQPRGTSIEQIRTDLRAALEDEDAHSIMLAIDSPGGSVDGIVDMADEIRAARKQKRIEAHVSGMAASAAYWLAAQSDRIYATRGSSVGSIGVLSTVIDDHRRLEQAGVDVRYVTSVEGKVGAGAPGKATTHRDLNQVKAEVDAWHGRFIDAVAAGRGVPREEAAAWGDARVHFAEDAKAIGLIDGVRDESAVMESLRQRGRAAASSQQRGVTMSAEEGAPAMVAATPQPPAATPTSARDLRDAYPEAVAQIERDAVADERARVAAIATACNEQSQPVVAIGLAAIADGRAASEALGAMLRAVPKAPAAMSFTGNGSPTIDQIRAAAAANQPVGPAPAANVAGKMTEAQLRDKWKNLGPEQKAEWRNEETFFRAWHTKEGLVI